MRSAALVPALLLATGAFAQPALHEQLQDTLRKLPHSQARVSAYVLDLETGEAVFSQKADVAMIPASTMKLFVMAAALQQLGADFRFTTTLATDGIDLYVVGGGDPAFGDEALCRRRGETITDGFERWARRLLAGEGSGSFRDLVVDETIFDDQRVHPTWETSDLSKWYAAPVGGLNFNDNCLDITVEPGEAVGALARVRVQPETTLARIINNCRTGGEGSPVLHHPQDTFTYHISGRCTTPWPFVSVSFPDPGLLFADSFRTVLAQRGVELAGGIRRERVRHSDRSLPGSLMVVARESTPLVEVLSRVGKDSQNLFAECLLKRLGYEWAVGYGYHDPQGSWALGARAVSSFLQRARIDTAGLQLADGSGLSRENACTARQLTALLAYCFRQPFGTVLHENLSQAGVDGSLRSRLTDNPGVVHAKTGTMRGVRSLAGYVNHDLSPRYAFAVLFNGYPGPSTPYRRIQDRFCEILAESASMSPVVGE